MIRLPDGPYQRRARRPRRTPRLDGGRAVRALLAFALAFGSVTAVAGAEYGAFAAMGCYLDAYGTRDPRPRRALLTALLGGGFVLAFFAGSLAAGHTWAMVGVLSLVTAAATLFVDTLRLSGPGGYFVLLVAALAAFLPPAGLTEAALRSGLVALGAACAWLFGSVGGRSPRNRPEQQAAAAALEEVAAFARVAGEAGPGRPGSTLVDAHRRACASLHRAWTALDDTRAGWRPHPPDARQLALHALLIRLEGVLVTVEQRLGEGGAAVPGRWPQRLSEAAGRVRAGCPPDAWAPPAALPDGGAASEPAARWPAPLPPRGSPGTGLRRLCALSSPYPAVALRVGLAVAVGTTIAAFVPVLHPAWVAVGAAAALQGGPGRRPGQRAETRLAGTVVGVGITAAAFHSYEPGVGVTVGLATAAHGLSRAVPPSSLFARMLFSTPVALLIVDAASPGGPGLGTLAAYRLLDLGLGLALGVATALLVPGIPRRRVTAAVHGAVTATGSALRERLRTGKADPRSEGTAWQAVADLWTMYDAVPAEEIRSTGTADRLWPALLAVRRLLVRILLAPPAPPAPDEARRAAAHAAVLARAARAGLPGSPALRQALSAGRPSVPEPAADPELGARLADLRRALAQPAPPA
ncbi:MULTISPECIES: FUSC family protein [Streptomyces]|uniref:FUSC family protein n=1 Tax=Streptomyces TaxID=1883 RepID=UPI000A5CAC07|nr:MULTISPECIES: FUSC family protein [Streptomyces]QXQ29122.1 hypothetical protein STALF2_22535 [Streptomyces albidoflavus]QXQ35055.1 hypothetical protein STALF4_22605 [Streptomyces albidoflavus]WTD96358.1 hypothetical protein OG950_08195 [Streptomyces albidoflavus]